MTWILSPLNQVVDTIIIKENMEKVDFASLAKKQFEYEKTHQRDFSGTIFIALNEYGDVIRYERQWLYSEGDELEPPVPEGTFWYVLIHNYHIYSLHYHDYSHSYGRYYESYKLVFIDKQGTVSSRIKNERHGYDYEEKEFDIIITTGTREGRLSLGGKPGEKPGDWEYCPSKMVLRMDEEWLYYTSTDTNGGHKYDWPIILSDILKLCLRCRKECRSKEEVRLLCNLVKQQQANKILYDMLLKNEKQFFPELIPVDSINKYGKDWNCYSWDDIDSQRVIHSINLIICGEYASLYTQLTIHWIDYQSTVNYEWEVDCSQELSIHKEFKDHLQLVNDLKGMANRVPLKIESNTSFFINGSYHLNLQLPPKIQGEKRMFFIGELLGVAVEKSSIKKEEVKDSFHSL